MIVEESQRQIHTKETVVGMKYLVSDAIEQIESFNSMLNDQIQNLYGEEHGLPHWEQYPALVLDSVLANPFVFDLIKNETFDFEKNHPLYKLAKHAQLNDPMIGYLSGYLSEYVQTCIDRKVHLCPSSVVYMPGRLQSNQL